jgi:hypothetical protein
MYKILNISDGYKKDICVRDHGMLENLVSIRFEEFEFPH